MTWGVALALLAGWIALVSLIGSLRDWLRRAAKVPPPEPQGPPIFVDGSNVMHWGEGVPSARPLALVLERLQAEGFAPVVWFDANVGYKLMDRHMGPADLARVLPVPAAAIRVAPSGQPADPLIIEATLAQKARLVSNDRFMDWRAQYPGLRAKGLLVKGQVRGDVVELTL